MKRRSVLKNLSTVSIAIPTYLTVKEDPFFNQWKDQYLKRWHTGHEYSLKVLEAMPVDQFDFRPTISQMPFGQQFTHFSYWNQYYLSFISGENPIDEPSSFDVETVREFTNAMHEKNTAAIELVTPANLFSKEWTERPYWRDHSTMDFLTRAYMHTTHHRAQAIMYLRHNNVEPPSFMF